MGNHDLALVRAARLDGGPVSPYWVERYRTRYDHHETFEGYLGRAAMTWAGAWEEDLEALREAMPEEHREFLASLPWVVEAPGAPVPAQRPVGRVGGDRRGAGRGA